VCELCANFSCDAVRENDASRNDRRPGRKGLKVIYEADLMPSGAARVCFPSLAVIGYAKFFSLHVTRPFVSMMRRKPTPQKPPLRFLMAINSELPKKWSRGQQGFVVNDDWLLWELKKDKKVLK